jgi:hypothetical protein
MLGLHAVQLINQLPDLRDTLLAERRGIRFGSLTEKGRWIIEYRVVPLRKPVKPLVICDASA